MDTERAQLTTGVPMGTLSIDVVIIDATISRALRENAGRLDLKRLAELEEELRGHIALLLPGARDAADSISSGSIELRRLNMRLDGIEQLVRRGLNGTPLAAHIQVQQLARDCQWLLQYTANTR
jgi:hypothetical protein